MQSIYTKGPTNVPEGLTRPTKSFTKHVWLSVLGLLLFMVIYVVLTIWFGKLSYNLFVGKGGLMNYLLAIGFAFLSLFMAKSLFIFTKREKDPMRRYLTEKEEPVLFDYLYKLADEAGAPRPHKVFLTDRVNASVSYDLSIINLIFPSKKNLEIGLGLVNVLSLGEFKAVLAHEFGHFAQRSMLLGRYVYVAQKIAAQIVSKRDILDKFLSGLSRFDLRIAWIGWILSILVWAIRSLIETCFSVVAIAERALSREMEFQADLVAVSLTGSDALIHALYKLQIADEAYENAIEVTNDELGNEKAVNNIYTLQTNYINKMAIVLRDTNYGKSPSINENDPASHRIFASRTYNPPKMWATHPADRDREDNAKRIYIASEIDNRTTEDLLSDPKKFEVEMTAKLIATAKVKTTLLTDEEGIEIQNKKYFNWSFLNPKYNSVFLNRYPFLNFKDVDEIYESHTDIKLSENSFKALYSNELSKKIDELKEIHEEIEALEIAKNEVVTAEKRIITHRGEQIKRREIPEILDSLKKEESVLRNELSKHDKLCRTLHYNAALQQGNGWASYLKSLTGLVHYTEHGITNIKDCARKFNNVLSVALADGRVTDSELLGILDSSREYYYAVRKIYNNSTNIKLETSLLQKLELKSYGEAYEEFKLPTPDKHNINDWVNVIAGWANNAIDILSKLRNVALEQLLDTEDKIKQAYLTGDKAATEASNTIKLLEKYDVLLPGNERPIKRKLNYWDRFFIGDGLFPTMARFSISAAMIIGALYLGNSSQKSVLHLYNGLDLPVNVKVDNEIVYLEANSYKSHPVNYGSTYTLITKTDNGKKIEEIETKFENPSHEYIYNIANAGAFIEYPIFYGYSREIQEKDTYLGAKKWFSTSVDYVLHEPPTSISLPSGSGGERREAIVGYSAIDPISLLGVVENEKEAQKMIASHVKWDATNSKNLLKWMDQLYKVENNVAIINERLKNNENEVESLRALQNFSDSIQKIKVCKDINTKAKNNPNNADLKYLVARCINDENLKDNAFIQGYEKHKQNKWLAFASAYTYTEREQWRKSFNAFKTATKNNDALSERIALDAERIRRFMAKKYPNNTTYDDFLHENKDVIFYNNLEKGTLGNIESDPNNSYYLLGKGEIIKAYSFLKKHKDYKPYVLRFLAVSKGATKNIVDDALKLSTNEGISYNTVWAALGLAMREKTNHQAYLDSLTEMGTDTSIVPEFCDLVQKGNFNEAEELIANHNFEEKAHFYVLAAIITNNTIPKKWKIYMKGILFVNQRPFF